MGWGGARGKRNAGPRTLEIPNTRRKSAIFTPRRVQRGPGDFPRGARITNRAPRNRSRRPMRRLGDTIIGSVARCDVGDWARRTKDRRLFQRRENKTTRIATGGSVRRFFHRPWIVWRGPRMGGISDLRIYGEFVEKRPFLATRISRRRGGCQIAGAIGRFLPPYA